MTESDQSIERFSLVESTLLLGAMCWAETQLFEGMGDRTTRAPEPEVVELLGRSSVEHGRNAEVLLGVLPTSFDAADWIKAPTPQTEAAMRSVFEDPTSSFDLVLGIGRSVLPRLIILMRRHLRGLDSVSDAPIMDALRFVLERELEEWQRTEELIQDMVTPERIDSGLVHQARLVRMLVATSEGLSAPFVQ